MRENTRNPSRPVRPLSDDVAAGFETTRQLLHDLLRGDRESAAVLAVVSTRLDLLKEQVDHLEAWREVRDRSREEILNELTEMRRLLAQARQPAPGMDPAVQVEWQRGRWTTIGMAITAAGGILLGLINLLKP